MPEEKNVNPATGFVERTSVDMKIYAADSDDAKWFKVWCDKQNMKFNAGIKLLRRLAEEHEFKVMMAAYYNELDNRISNVERLVHDKEMDKRPEGEVSVRKKPLAFGRNKKDGVTNSGSGCEADSTTSVS